MTVKPIVAWIGDVPIYHGERQYSERCLCGHDPYFTCPGWLHEPDVGGLEFPAASPGRPTAVTEAAGGRSGDDRPSSPDLADPYASPWTDAEIDRLARIVWGPR